jgi:hypothetical protein
VGVEYRVTVPDLVGEVRDKLIPARRRNRFGITWKVCPAVALGVIVSSERLLGGCCLVVEDLD